MASAQVLPSSRKQEHLEAGKRRLEEFRKKKAAERAKLAASTNQNNKSSRSVDEGQQTDSGQIHLVDTDGPITSVGHGPSIVVENKNINSDNDNLKAVSQSYESPQVSSYDMHQNAHFPGTNYNSSLGKVQISQEDQETKNHSTSGNGPLNDYMNPHAQVFSNDFKVNFNAQDTHSHVPVTDQRSQKSQVHTSYPSISSINGMSNEGENSLKNYTSAKPVSSLEFLDRVSTQILPKSESHTSNGSSQNPHRDFHSLYQDSLRPTPSTAGSAHEEEKSSRGSSELGIFLISDIGKRTKDSSASVYHEMQNSAMQSSGISPFSFDVRSSSSNMSFNKSIQETSSRRVRPSFLDSLDMPKATLASPFGHNEGEDSIISRSTFYNVPIFEKTSTEIEAGETFSKSFAPNILHADAHPYSTSMSETDVDNQSVLNGNQNTDSQVHQLYPTKHNEDFAALEQHIEDLTQEKFSLQRALEASQSLAESLAAENSSLTENYNQQRGVVNQLKSDMENLQEEMKAQLAELESFRMEYTNARLECSAADERANILASEVIGLEEKTLKLRSSELKLGKQLENTQEEISLIKKRMSSMEKDRQDLKLTIDALQEEKKVLQSKLRKASTGGKTVDSVKTTIGRKDTWTSTDDLETAESPASVSTHNQGRHNTISVQGSEVSDFILQPELEAGSTNIPLDQRRMIENINALLSELAVEKEELTQALSSELSQTSKLKVLNEELTRKLEAQTQRLELLTSQSIANENLLSRQAATHTIHDTSAYADEGDEVVERVLGWIMKLFPGGPSRRRVNKRLSYPV